MLKTGPRGVYALWLRSCAGRVFSVLWNVEEGPGKRHGGKDCEEDDGEEGERKEEAKEEKVEQGSDDMIS